MMLKTWSVLWIFTFGTYCLSGQVNNYDSLDADALQTLLKKARSNKSEATLADIYFALGKKYDNEYYSADNALDFYLRAQQYYKVIGNIDQIARIKLIVGERYLKSGFIKEAEDQFTEVLKYFVSAANKRGEAQAIFALAKVSSERGDLEQSLVQLNKALMFSVELKDSTLLTDLLLDKVEKYVQLNEPDSALIIAKTAFDISKTRREASQISRSLYYIGYANYKKKEYARAVKYLSEGAQLLPIRPYDEKRRDLYRMMSKSYAGVGDFRSSYLISQKYINLNDSILDHDRIAAINNLSIKHQSTQKSKEIELLTNEKASVLQRSMMQRNALHFVAAGFGLLLIALYYIIRFYTQRIRTEKIINEQQHEIDRQKIKELEDSLQINNMQSMIIGQERERERIAKDLHDSLGGLLSTVRLQFDQLKSFLMGHKGVNQFDKTTLLLNTAVDEVRSISRNLQPGALSRLGIVAALNDLVNRFDDDGYPEIFFQHYNLPDKIDDMIALNVYRIIQELIHNTIKYAHATEVLVQLNMESDDLFVQYEDDGKGFDYNNELRKKGMGLDNIESRIKYLKGQVSVETEMGKGVSYFIKIPLT